MPRPTPDPGPRTPGGTSETLLFGAIICLGALCALVLVAAHLAAALFGDAPFRATLADAGVALARLPRHLSDPAAAWPPGLREALPGPVAYFASLAAVVAPTAGGGLWGLARYRRSRGRDGLGVQRSARFARGGDLRRLVVRGPEKGRLVLGRVEGRLVAAERRASLCLVGPTESGKTSGVAVPIILERDRGHGPIIAATVKGDLYDVTGRRRAEVGKVKIFDPTGILAARAKAEGRSAEAVATATWSPLRMCRTITGAQSAARALTDVAARSGLEGADFFMGAAKELLWSVLYAAAVGGFEMRHVVRWVTIQDRPHYNRQGLVVRPSEMEQILTVAAADAVRHTEATQALDGLRGMWDLDERSRSSIFATARIVIEAWSDPVVAASSAGCDITPEWLLGGDNTLYIVAPARDQGRFRPVFACMVSDLVNAAFETANRSRGGELARPLLVLLDEAANICPVRELPTWASTCASHGIQLVHVWQDRSQQRARYGREGAETIWNNSAAKIICSGLADAATGEVTQLLGEEETERRGWSADVGGPRRSVSTQTVHRRLVSADSLRRQRPGQALLIYKHLPPSALSLRLWYRDSALKALKNGDGAATSSAPRQRRLWPRVGASA